MSHEINTCTFTIIPQINEFDTVSLGFNGISHYVYLLMPFTLSHWQTYSIILSINILRPVL